MPARSKIRDSHDIIRKLSRVSRDPHGVLPGGSMRVWSPDIHSANVHVNAGASFATAMAMIAPLPAVSKIPYENAVQDMSSGLEVRERGVRASRNIASATPAVASSPDRKLAAGVRGVGRRRPRSHGTLYL